MLGIFVNVFDLFALRNYWQKYFLVCEPRVWVLVAYPCAGPEERRGQFHQNSLSNSQSIWSLLHGMHFWMSCKHLRYQLSFSNNFTRHQLIDGLNWLIIYNFRGYFCFFVNVRDQLPDCFNFKDQVGDALINLALGSLSFVIENMQIDLTPNVFF